MDARQAQDYSSNNARLVSEGDESMNVKSVVADSPRRLAALNGLRGIAALIVACRYFWCAFLPWIIPDLANTHSG
jgi:hypothetical protein